MRWVLLAGSMLLAASPAVHAQPRGLDVEIWTDRGSGGVYQSGDAMEVRVNASMDAYLLVYELDSEGRVNLLFPDQGSRGLIQGRTTLRVPSERSNLDLVVEGPVGQGYLVAVVSTEPFLDLPWYLRPYDPHAQEIGYEGVPEVEEEGVTREGRIVGDPFVAMERIRRRVLPDTTDQGLFATAYTTYYVHQEVRYPRYLCYDCHRPGYWAWWAGFDPYYTHCSVFDFRVNWHWGWGPGYWYGAVPYYYYVYRVDCPPRYRVYATRHIRHSSWDGWRSWGNIWGVSMRRYKSDPPAGYIPPTKYESGSSKLPPGFISSRAVARGRHGGGSLVPIRRGGGDVAERPVVSPSGRSIPRSGARDDRWGSEPPAKIGQGRQARPNQGSSGGGQGRPAAPRAVPLGRPSEGRPGVVSEARTRDRGEAPQRIERSREVQPQRIERSREVQPQRIERNREARPPQRDEVNRGDARDGDAKENKTRRSVEG